MVNTVCQTRRSCSSVDDLLFRREPHARCGHILSPLVISLIRTRLGLGLRLLGTFGDCRSAKSMWQTGVFYAIFLYIYDLTVYISLLV